jgi:hypothetical protein
LAGFAAIDFWRLFSKLGVLACWFSFAGVGEVLQGVTMSEKKPVMLREAVQQALASVKGPMALDQFCRQVLSIRPSKAKNPMSSVRSYLRQEQAGETLVFLDVQTILPLPIAMQGVRFRTTLARKEATRGVMIIRPAFDYFQRGELDPTMVRLLDQGGRSLPVRIVTLQTQIETPFGRQAVEEAAFELADWFQSQRVRRDDSILVTVEDWTAGYFRLEHEPAGRQRRQEMERQDRELADLLFDMLEASGRESIYGHVAIPTAYARLSNSRSYPGHHWLEVVERDPRMRYDGWAIHYSDYRSPLELMVFGDRAEPPVGEFSRAQGRQVYRFKAALCCRPGLWRTIEIQGKQTLAELDLILRDAFEHDMFDHLGGFWKRVRRGQTKRFREVELGSMNPLGEGDGAGIQIAGLGLEPGQQLKYVYDFGDWVEHLLTLEAISEPESQSTYPRVVARNRPRYSYCQSCANQGRKERATWICLKCSERQDQGVLLCQKCLRQQHQDHYVEKILY